MSTDSEEILAQLDAHLEADGVAQKAEDAHIASEAIGYYLRTAHIIDPATEVLGSGGAVVPNLYPINTMKDFMLSWMSESARCAPT